MMEETRAKKRRRPAPTRWSLKEADDAVLALKEATAKVGLTLPSLDRQYSVLDSPLVELGRARPDIVQELAGFLGELVELREKVAALPKEEAASD